MGDLFQTICYKSPSSDISVFFNPHAPDRFTPPAPVAQKSADQRWLIANSAKKATFLYKMMW